MTKNKESTRYYSTNHEESICKALGGHRQPNSGAAKFNKGDIIVESANMLIEAKTTMTDKESFSIKKDWVTKNKNEAFAVRMYNEAVCFNFGPNQSNYYVINERLMKFLVEKLNEEYLKS